MESRRRNNLTLIWQAALIILPVAVLSGVALYFLREDKASIEQEARDRAQILMPELARRLGQRVGETLNSQADQGPQLQGEIVDGKILSPPDYPTIPTPADWPNEMTSDQARLWRAAQEAMFQRWEPMTARKALVSLAAASAQSAVRANAEFSLLVLEARRSPTPKLVQQCADLARKSPEVMTDSGAPLADLSLLFAVKNIKTGRIPPTVLSELERRVREHPSFLTPELLEATERAAGDPEDRGRVQALKKLWSAQEKTLSLLRVLIRRPMDSMRPSETWLGAGTESFLALCNPIRRGWQVRLLPAALVEQTFRAALGQDRAQLPAYAAAAVEIGGKRWYLQGSHEAIQAPAMVLASGDGRLEIGSSHPFTLSLDLVHPPLLYAGYRRRLWLLAGLILSAAATAMIGLVSLWQGFRRQVRLSEMKSNFVSSVSHELRAPIASVRLMAESLERGKIGDEAKQREYFHHIVQECRRLSSLVENVLDFSRIDQGHKQYSFEPIDLTALVQRAVALMEPCAAERQVSLELVPPAPEAVGLEPCWDGEAAEQALVNLLDNAIKHSPAEAVVKVGTELAEARDGHPATVTLWVEDQGDGIPAEAQARIFDLFYRHGSELRRETKGVGIGLSIVKHVAEAHGGRVLVHSIVGQGSRFELELPMTPPAVNRREQG